MICAQDLDTIRTYPPFGKLNRAILEALTPCIRKLSLAAGKTVCLQDEHAETFYLVVDGRLTLSRLSMEGQEKVLDILEAGAIISETALFMDQARHVGTVRAVTPSTLYSFQIAPFKSVLANSPACCMMFLTAMSCKVVESVREIESLTMESAISRVAGFLVRTVQRLPKGRQHFTLPVQKQLLASRLGITPETLSRIFKRFRKENLIHIEGMEVEVKNVGLIQQRYVGESLQPIRETA